MKKSRIALAVLSALTAPAVHDLISTPVLNTLSQKICAVGAEFLRRALLPIKRYAERNLVMSLDTAFQTQYRQEFVIGFEQHVSLLRETVTKEGQIQGNVCVFDVIDSGGAEAQTRGINGLIPARADNNTQNSCQLTEWHDLVRKTGFNIFGSQGNQRMAMQMTSMGVLNRKIDNQIITELNTGTVTAGGTGTVFNVNLFMNASVKLQNASVPWDSRVTFLCCPATLAYLMQAPEWSNAMWVDMRPLPGGAGMWQDKPQAFRWLNTLVVSHPNLPGKGTTAEKNFLYHQSAIGQAVDVRGLVALADYNREQDYTWARTSCYMGAKLLQNSGVVIVTSDGSAYA